jgi:trimethylamine:corrinoid methyltransferase-like protein
MDCEVLQMIQRYFEEATFATTDEDLAFDAIKEVGRAGTTSASSTRRTAISTPSMPHRQRLAEL